MLYIYDYIFGYHMTAFLEQDSHTKDRKAFHYSTVNVKMKARSARSGRNKSVDHRPNLTHKKRESASYD